MSPFRQQSTVRYTHEQTVDVDCRETHDLRVQQCEPPCIVLRCTTVATVRHGSFDLLGEARATERRHGNDWGSLADWSLGAG